MQIIIAGRHFTVSDSLKKEINERLEVMLDHVHLKISTVRVVLDVEHTHRCKAEVIINMKNSVMEADVTTRDMYESIDAVIGKIEIQVRKYLDKKQHHHGEASLKNMPSINDTADIVDEYDEA
ncbi:MAG: ribosome-associated translation inhibitor RaiA [Victivallales bacterium]|nr:ribosome-associated translation inhibitor RaiA [Victivallales bacterium]